MNPAAEVKSALAQEVLKRGTAFIHLDPRRPGVTIPANLRNQHQVVLQFGWDMPVPILDMHVGRDCIRGVMSFKGKRELCIVPWSAVFAVIAEDAKGAMFEDAMPEEIKAELVKVAEARKAAPPARSNVVSFADAKRRLRPNAPPKGSPFRPGA